MIASGYLTVRRTASERRHGLRALRLFARDRRAVSERRASERPPTRLLTPDDLAQLRPDFAVLTPAQAARHRCLAMVDGNGFLLLVMAQDEFANRVAWASVSLGLAFIPVRAHRRDFERLLARHGAVAGAGSDPGSARRAGAAHGGPYPWQRPWQRPTRPAPLREFLHVREADSRLNGPLLPLTVFLLIVAATLVLAGVLLVLPPEILFGAAT